MAVHLNRVNVRLWLGKSWGSQLGMLCGAGRLHMHFFALLSCSVLQWPNEFHDTNVLETQFLKHS